VTATILLARHGETDWNREGRWQGHADQPLNDLGREQSRVLAGRLAPEPPDGLYSSDFARARETAEIIGTALGLPVRLEPRLREVDVGEWSGLTMDEVRRLYPDAVRRRGEGETGWESGESYEAMGLRVLEALDAIASAHPAERILVVTHGGPMRAVWLASGGAWGSRPRYANCELEAIAVEPGRIRRIDSGGGGGLHQQVQG
jgi:broad specificity phosphatase PhoE